MSTTKILRSDFKNASGLGSAGSGSHHWWHQRLTAIFLIPFFLWFMYFLAQISGQPFSVIIDLLKKPCHTTCLIIFSILIFYHASLGMRVVIEDYIPNLCLRNTLIVGIQFISFVTVISFSIALIYILIV